MPPARTIGAAFLWARIDSTQKVAERLGDSSGIPTGCGRRRAWVLRISFPVPSGLESASACICPLPSSPDGADGRGSAGIQIDAKHERARAVATTYLTLEAGSDLASIHVPETEAWKAGGAADEQGPL